MMINKDKDKVLLMVEMVIVLAVIMKKIMMTCVIGFSHAAIPV